MASLIKCAIDFISSTFNPRVVTSGIRLGTPAVTTRGLKVEDMKSMAHLINEAIVQKDNASALTAIKKEVHTMMSQKPLFSA